MSSMRNTAAVLASLFISGCAPKPISEGEQRIADLEAFQSQFMVDYNDIKDEGWLERCVDARMEQGEMGSLESIRFGCEMYQPFRDDYYMLCGTDHIEIDEFGFRYQIAGMQSGSMLTAEQAAPRLRRGERLQSFEGLDMRTGRPTTLFMASTGYVFCTPEEAHMFYNAEEEIGDIRRSQLGERRYRDYIEPE